MTDGDINSDRALGIDGKPSELKSLLPDLPLAYSWTLVKNRVKLSSC
jgi:hypothetical protein